MYPIGPAENLVHFQQEQENCEITWNSNILYGRHFASNISKFIFANNNIWISIRMIHLSLFLRCEYDGLVYWHIRNVKAPLWGEPVDIPHKGQLCGKRFRGVMSSRNGHLRILGLHILIKKRIMVARMTYTTTTSCPVNNYVFITYGHSMDANASMKTLGLGKSLFYVDGFHNKDVTWAP